MSNRSFFILPQHIAQLFGCTIVTARRRLAKVKASLKLNQVSVMQYCQHIGADLVETHVFLFGERPSDDLLQYWTNEQRE